MRLLHTSDWHLGRGLHGVNLIEDQSHLLDQTVSLAGEVRPQSVLIAGDGMTAVYHPRKRCACWTTSSAG
jgi:DNA repair exonuclease SbcCD nuclease subunit